jgi:palmitoyltransferase
VSTYDHHCPWLGNCIGERNRKYFYAYLWAQLLQLLAALMISCYTYIHGETKQAVTSGIVTMSVESLFLLFVVYLTCFHTYLAFVNTTTWECLSWQKVSYLRDWPRHLGSPFNLGWRANLKLYFCYNLGDDNYFVWKMPKRRPDINN